MVATGIEPPTRTCALTGNGTNDLLVPGSTTEPYRPGRRLLFNQPSSIMVLRYFASFAIINKTRLIILYIFEHLFNVFLEQLVRNGIARSKGMFTLRLFDPSCQISFFSGLFQSLIPPTVPAPHPNFRLVQHSTSVRFDEIVGRNYRRVMPFLLWMRFKKGTVSSMGACTGALAP